MNYNTEEWLSIRVSADKLIYCKTRTLSRSKFSFQWAMEVFFEEGGCLLSLSLPLWEILAEFSRSRKRSSRRRQNWDRKAVAKGCWTALLCSLPTMQAFFKERASYLTDISQNSRPDNGGSAISRDESKTFVRSKNGTIVRIVEWSFLLNEL